MIDITQIDNQLSTTKDLMVIIENQAGDTQVLFHAPTPSWLQASLQKKKKVVQIIQPPFDVVSSFLQKPPKMKRTKVMSKLAIDKTSGNLCVVIVRPITKMNVKEA